MTFLNTYMCMYVYMPTRTISITEEAYERLRLKKEGKESFSDVILKLTKKGDILRFAGILSDKEADDLKRSIKEARERSAARMERIRKRLNE